MAISRRFYSRSKYRQAVA